MKKIAQIILVISLVAFLGAVFSFNSVLAEKHDDRAFYGSEEDPYPYDPRPEFGPKNKPADESTGEGERTKTFDESSKDIDELTKDSKTPETEKDTKGTSTKTPPSIPDSFSVSTYLKLGDQKSRVGGAGILKVIVDAIDLLVKLTGSLALIVFIIGALLTVVSEGQQDKLEKGKTAMLYAVYGILISLMAFVIVTFVQSILF